MTNRSAAPVRPAAAKRAKPAKTVKAPAPEAAAAPVEAEAVAAAPVEAPVEATMPTVAAPDLKAEKAGKKKDKKEKKAKKAKKAKKEAVLIRFDDAQLVAIDGQAEALGLSRAAWVRMVIAKALVAG